MKTIIISLMLLFATSALSAQYKLTIVVDGIENVKGQLMVGVYNQNSFMKAAPIASDMVKIDGETITVELKNIAVGEYAVSLFQDENENYELDMGTFGPTEKYGFSNNAKGKMGPPSFADCKFKVEEDTIIYITI